MRASTSWSLAPEVRALPTMSAAISGSRSRVGLRCRAVPVASVVEPAFASSASAPPLVRWRRRLAVGPWRSRQPAALERSSDVRRDRVVHSRATPRRRSWTRAGRARLAMNRGRSRWDRRATAPAGRARSAPGKVAVRSRRGAPGRPPRGARAHRRMPGDRALRRSIAARRCAAVAVRSSADFAAGGSRRDGAASAMSTPAVAAERSATYRRASAGAALPVDPSVLSAGRHAKVKRRGLGRSPAGGNRSCKAGL